MNRIKKLLLLLGVTVLLLTGCNVKVVNEMYCLPKRSEEYNNLQAEIDKVRRAPAAGTDGGSDG